MIQLLSRTAHLAALAIVPRGLSPEPSSPDGGMAVLGALVLLVPPALSVWLTRRYDVIEAKAAVGFFILSDILLLYIASSTFEQGLPLLKGYYFIAPFLWFGLGAVLATLAGQHLGTSFKNKKTAAFVATVAIGFFVFRDASGFIASTKEQWKEVLARDPAHDRAVVALADDLVSTGGKELEACVKRKTDSCPCRTLRAERQLAADRPERAIAELELGACANHAMDARSESDRAVALVLTGHADEAEVITTAAADSRPDDPKILYAQALIHQRRGDADTLDLAKRAVDKGAGRGAELLVAMLLIQSNDLEGAKAALGPYIERYPDDPKGRYNRALIADRENDYNKAREGYYKVLQLDPGFRDARYNLAKLALRFGATDEAKLHASKFAQTWPDDPRRFALMSQVGLPP